MKRLLAILTLFVCALSINAQAICSLSSFAYEVKNEGDLFYLVLSQPDDLHANYHVFLNQKMLESDGVRFGPFEADCETFYSLLVVHKDNDACSVQANMGSICIQDSSCMIGALEISYPECNPNGVVDIDINFKYENVSDSFTISENDKSYGIFAYADLPVSFGPVESSCEKERQFTVSDFRMADCKSSTSGIVICCPFNCEGPEFKIAEMECSEEELHMKLVMSEDFEETNIQVKINERYIEDFEIDLPYISFKTDLPLNVALHTVSVCSVGIASVCCYSQEFRTDECSPNLECKIYDVSYATLECQQGQEAYISLNFEYQNNTSDSFRVHGNGANYGEYAYADLPVDVGPFEASCDIFYELVIFDPTNKDCVFVDSLIICCDTGCLEPIYEVYSRQCLEEVVQIKVQLVHADSSNQLSIFVNNSPIDSYEVEFPYVYITAERSDVPIYELTICSETLNNFECCYTQLIEIPCGDPVDCEIGTINVKPADCIDTGLPGFYIDFDHAKTGSKGFTLKGNGINYGDYKYESLPIFVSSNDNCEQFYEFIVIDNEFQCSNSIEFGQFCCSDNCSFKITDERTRCEDGVLREIAFNLQEETDPIKKYTVYLAGKLIGETSNNNVFQEFDTNIELDATGQIQLTVCDGECCVTRTIDVTACVIQQPSCSITNVHSNNVECGKEGLSFSLDFDHQGTNSAEFEVFSVFGKYGTYKYSDLPLSIEGFPFVNIGFNILFICDKGSLCCQAHLFSAPFCSDFNGKNVADNGNQRNRHRYIRQNPTTMEVVLDSPVTGTSYQILDSSGKLVKSFTSDQLQSRTDISNLRSGLYMVRIQHEGQIKIEKLIITNQ